MRYRYGIVCAVFVLVGILLFVPPFRAGEDHGQALIQKIGMSYGGRTEAVVVTPPESAEKAQLSIMEMIDTTISYVGLQMDLPAQLVGPENLYCVEDGFSDIGINGVHYVNITGPQKAEYYGNIAGEHKGKQEFFENNGSFGQISTTLKNGWFGVKFFLLGNQYMQIAVRPTANASVNNDHRTGESIDLVNVPGGYMNVKEEDSLFRFGETRHEGQGIAIYAYTPEQEIVIQYFDAKVYNAVFEGKNKGLYVDLDRRSAIIESARNMKVFKAEGKPRKEYFGISPANM